MTEMTPDQVRRTAFTESLGDDEWIAVLPNGEPVCRAKDKAGVVRAYPHAAAFFSGADFKEGRPAAEPFRRSAGTLHAPKQGVPVSPGTPIDPSTQAAKEPAPAIDPAKQSAPQGLGADLIGTKIAGSISPQPTVTAYNTEVRAGTAELLKQIDQQKKDADALTSLPPSKTGTEQQLKTEAAAETEVKTRRAARRPQLDHDNSGKEGGSKKGSESTAAKGAARKRAAKA